MKCKLNKMVNNRFFLLLGIVLMAAGILFYKVMDATGLAARAAGFFTGLGGSFTVIWLFWWGRKKLMSKERFEDAERQMSDERGQMVNLKATAVMNCCAVAGVAVMTLAAVWEGSNLFMALGTGSCLVIAVGGAIARRWYNENL